MLQTFEMYLKSMYSLGTGRNQEEMRLRNVRKHYYVMSHLSVI